MEEFAEEEGAPIWPAFGDLMACLFGLFVLFFVWAIALQVDLSKQVEVAKAETHAESTKRQKLEQALALAGAFRDGRITLVDGRIGIGGSVLFQLGSADTQADAAPLLEDLAKVLKGYTATNEDQLIMVSGFTDDRPVRDVGRGFKDNWDLSSARALTVVRSLVAAGVPRERIFAAGFGDGHPIAPNTSDELRAKNRRVEIRAIPKNDTHVRVEGG